MEGGREVGQTEERERERRRAGGKRSREISYLESQEMSFDFY